MNTIEVERDYEASWGDAHALRFEDRRDQAVGGRGQLYSLSHGIPSHPRELLWTEGMMPPYKKLLLFCSGFVLTLPPLPRTLSPSWPSDVAARQGSPTSSHLRSASAPRAVGCRPASVSGIHTSLILCGIEASPR